MKNLPLKFLLLLAIALVFSLPANAQLCGEYTTTLHIKTVENEPVETAVVQLLPVENDETRGKTFARDEKDLSKFSITFFEGHQLAATYKLIISADGFETLEKEIKFPHCKTQNFDIQLVSDKKPLIVLSGTVYDANGAVLVNARITATDETGRKFETVTNAKGVYELNLPYKNYEQQTDFRMTKYGIAASHEYFETYVLKNFYIVPAYKGKMMLDLALNLAQTENCGVGGCIQLESRSAGLPDRKI
jgi:hypothetical protein